jgi:HlyD family secretion protein
MNQDAIRAHRAIRRYLVGGLALVIFGSLVIGGWAAATNFSGAVVAAGSLVVDSSVKKVQHQSGGIIGEIRVREGDRVQAGDIVVRLDETQTRAAVLIVSNALDDLLARQARLEAERENTGRVAFAPVLLDRARDKDSQAARAVAAEQRLFELRRTAREGQKAQLRERIAQLKEEIQGLTGQAEAKKREVVLIHKELKGVKELWEKNLTPISRVTALERDSARLEGESSQLTGTIAQAKGKITEIELQIIQIDQELRTEVGKELAEVRSKIAELSEKKIAAEDQLKRIDIRSPQSGVVHQMTVHTVGGVIPPGEAIMLIVPDADTLTVEVKIAPQDIDQLYIGQKAILRFSAFNQRTTPEIQGTVRLISADLSQDQRTGVSYFLVRIAPDATEVLRLGEVRMVPGMPVEAFIQTGERTVISYLLKPLRDQATRAFKEK